MNVCDIRMGTSISTWVVRPMCRVFILITRQLHYTIFMFMCIPNTVSCVHVCAECSRRGDSVWGVCCANRIQVPGCIPFVTKCVSYESDISGLWENFAINIQARQIESIVWRVHWNNINCIGRRGLVGVHLTVHSHARRVRAHSRGLCKNARIAFFYYLSVSACDPIVGLACCIWQMCCILSAMRAIDLRPMYRYVCGQ